MSKDFKAVADYMKNHMQGYKPKEDKVGAELARHLAPPVPDRSQDQRRVVGSFEKPLSEIFTSIHSMPENRVR